MPAMTGQLYPPTLRDLRKRRTSMSIWHAALELFAEHGPSRPTVREIAERAGVSERTFFRYYPSKEQLTIGAVRGYLRTFVRALETRPAEETVLVSSMRAWAEVAPRVFGDPEVEGRAHRLLPLLKRVLEANPELYGLFMIDRTLAGRRIAELARRRMGIDSARDRRPAMLATLVLAAETEAIVQWGSEARPPAVDVARSLLAEIATLHRRC
ncbi:TetR family transcriptional regulator [Amycolatopsis nigrescens]|uniref:TetR family transcriptional regulator n=1 Tax=Amycolatopsis nigrescens TaxID=381445 RepID=UPI0003A46C9E|nr:TetR family transcriptional regulator [Amycolatopsis nigrescens]